MAMFDYFRASRQASAAVAKERLQIIVAHERAERNRPSYLPRLQKELLEVICKYVHVDPADVQVSVDKNRECEILALNVVLPVPEEAQTRRA
jgi:cell division topological specificity factor